MTKGGIENILIELCGLDLAMPFDPPTAMTRRKVHLSDHAAFNMNAVPPRTQNCRLRRRSSFTSVRVCARSGARLCFLSRLSRRCVDQGALS